MKRYRFLLLILLMACLYVGCNENEIALYNGDNSVNFYSTKIAYTFRDTDYVRGREWVDLTLEVEIQGEVKEPKDFCLKTDENNSYTDKANVAAENKYTYTALDTTIQGVTIRVERPKNVTTEEPCRADLVFDLTNSFHQFAPGREDKRSCKVEVSYKIKPSDDWGWYFWGRYSDGKYFFMMDIFQKVHKDIPMTILERDKLRAAYAEYRKTNPPILDDDGSEIVFELQM
ncbi:DUF4843 domain-containing protein [Gabonibacter chumensis]|uniref:DUF4843 domain-containing protein n=1 Tax=Gabonibacter chumensis TaxID=2972474 RepID=UPI0025741E25|nr:DUF4843 domain-containing protein [Gabonibacter chumensis]MCR9011929.1 DUF4843 domain-containing protein [Gabonibacter chumensis]